LCLQEATNETAEKFILPDNLLWVIVGGMNNVDKASATWT